MKKIISIVSAAMLGVIVMIIPILVVTPIYQHQEAELAASEERFQTELDEEVKAAQALGKADVGAAAYPSSLIQAGILVILGLIVAFGTSLFIKKRVPPSI